MPVQTLGVPPSVFQAKGQSIANCFFGIQAPPCSVSLPVGRQQDSVGLDFLLPQSSRLSTVQKQKREAERNAQCILQIYTRGYL